MANPFLMEDEMGEVEADNAVNPFLMQTSVDAAVDENPFEAQASNPFAFDDDEGDVPVPESSADIDAAMSFFGTTIEAEEDTLSIKSTAEDEDAGIKKNIPTRPVPPQTQQLINSVSNQMEEASSELLGRIPATRSPSPVSMLDLHSPSPTPDSGLADLLDVSDSASSGNTQGMDVDMISSTTVLDNPFGVPTAIPNIQGTTPAPSPAKQQPPRPPPPRPAPPRPAPPGVVAPQRPSPPPPPPKPAVAAESDDLFDMFGTTKPPKPPPPKTKEDILSLFEKAEEPTAKPDLMSDDIVLKQSAEEEQPTTNDEFENGADDPIFSSVLIRPDESTHDISCQPQSAVPPVRNAIAPQELANRHRAPTPDIEITTVEDLPRSDDEEETVIPESSESQTQDAADVTTKPQEEEEVEVNLESTQHSPPTESAIDVTEPEVMDTGLDFVPASGAASANPFASPDEDESTYPPADTVTNIFATDEPELQETNIFSASSEIVTTTAAINIFAAEPEPVVSHATISNNIFAAEPDEFDAFSAKFDSVKKDNISILDGFAGSRAVTPTGGDGKL